MVAAPGACLALKFFEDLDPETSPFAVRSGIRDATKNLFTEAARKELVVKGRAQTVVAYECRARLIASRALTRPEGDLSEADRRVELAG